jgi:predicted nucleic acid-binding protein
MPITPLMVFVDTSAYIALTRRDDEHHQDALAILDALRQQRARLYTTNFVVAETHTLLLRYLGNVVARTFLQAVDKSKITNIVRAEVVDEEAARAIIYRYTDKDFSLTDAISFAVMERMGISQAFAFDKHFAQYGVKVLEP